MYKKGRRRGRGGGKNSERVREIEMQKTNEKFSDALHFPNHFPLSFFNPTPTGPIEDNVEAQVKPTSVSPKAVGARKRKPTQISKIVDKPSSDCFSGTESELNDYFPPNNLHNNNTLFSNGVNNNNNISPPYKKLIFEPRNGMIQNILSELKSAKNLSQLQNKSPESQEAHYENESHNESNNETEATLHVERRGRRKRKKVDLRNVKTLLSSPTHVEEEEEEDGVDMGSGSLECFESGFPFKCRICSYGSLDKATLLRHIKTHCGERPFQCKVCFFAFTTKANCERHVRNRHGEYDRTQIRSFIVHNTSSSSNNSSDESEEERSKDRNKIKTPYNLTSGGHILKPFEAPSEQKASPSQTTPPLNFSVSGKFLNTEPMSKDDPIALSLVKKSQAEEISKKNEEEGPLDLSMDAVDLSVKKNLKNVPVRGSLLRPRPIYAQNTEITNLLSTSPFIRKMEPMVHPQISLPSLGVGIPCEEFKNSLFENYLSPFTLPTSSASSPAQRDSTDSPHPPFGLFPFGPTPQFPPFSLQQPFRTLPPASTSLTVSTSINHSNAILAPSPSASYESIVESSVATTTTNEEVGRKRKCSGSSLGEKKMKSASPCSGSISIKKEKKASIQMGNDYQKPKQRRYRTERPFFCPHCPARFTLRSNMERHGKHQHSAVWQRSPSNRVINRQQKSSSALRPSLQPPTLVQPPSKFPPLYEPLKEGVNVKAVIAQQLKRKLSNSLLNEELLKGSEIKEGEEDLASVSQLLDRVKNSNIAQYFEEGKKSPRSSQSEEEEEDEESSAASERSRSESEEEEEEEEGEKKPEKKKSAYSTAPHKISCPHCTRRFPWTSSLRRHLLTHTGQKPYQCSQCPLLFTTKSNCDRHLVRKHNGIGRSSSVGKSENNSQSEEEESQSESRDENNSQSDAKSETKSQSGWRAKKFTGKKRESRRQLSRRRERKLEIESESSVKATHIKNETALKSSERIPISLVKNKRGKKRQFIESEKGENLSTTKNDEILGSILNNKKANLSSTPKNSKSHSNGSGSPDDVTFRCHLCEASATEREVLLTHMEETHSDTYQMLIDKGALSTSPQSENGESIETIPNDLSNNLKEGTHRKVMCVFCVRKFWSVEDLRRHIRSHSGERPFSCPYCSRRFTLKHSMLRHLKKHAAETNSGTPKIAKAEENEESNLIGRLLGIQDEELVEQLLSRPDAKDAAKILGLVSGRHSAIIASSN